MSHSHFIATSTDAPRSATPSPICDEPLVSLVFPPLVDSNFGRYYPSTAVLAAYLEEHGIEVRQTDLNQRFAHRLLDPDHLRALGRGELLGEPGRFSVIDGTAVAARLLARTSSLLYDASGRFWKTAEAVAAPHELLATIVRHYRVDRRVSELVSPSFAADRLAAFYEDFYEASSYADELASTIRLVGISAPMGPQLGPAVVFARWLKRRRPELRIVLGGPAASLMAVSDLELLLTGVPELDAVVRYEGEAPLLELAKQIDAAEWDPGRVPGASSVRDGRSVHVPPVSGRRLAELPFAVYDPEILSALSRPTVSIVQARGCYWGRCSYCDYVELYEGSPSYRTRPVERFVDEMAHHVETLGTRSFYVVTESIPATFARRMSEEILARGLDVRWSSFAMVDHRFTDEVFEVMARAGCETLTIGMETMTDRVLKLVDKASTKELNVAFMRRAAKHGVALHINLIPDLPTTTREEALETLRVMRSLRDSIQTLGIFPFEATRSSEIGRRPERFGLKVLQEGGGSGQAQYSSNNLVVRDDAMSDEDRRSVIAQFRAFADEIAAARRPAKVRAFTMDSVLTLPDDCVDLAFDGPRIHAYNWTTRRKFTLKSTAWRPVIDEVRARRRVDGRELTRHFPSTEQAQRALEHAVAIGLFDVHAAG